MASITTRADEWAQESNSTNTPPNRTARQFAHHPLARLVRSFGANIHIYAGTYKAAFNQDNILAALCENVYPGTVVFKDSQGICVDGAAVNCFIVFVEDINLDSRRLCLMREEIIPYSFQISQC